MVKPLEVLQKYWHYDSFIEPQDKIINSVLAKNNTVVILPTGGGKSICYQIPALLNEGVCLVISPLIALMTDQVKNLKNKGIKALSVTSALSQDEIIKSFDNLQFGNYKFLYLSPEKLQSPLIQQKIKQLHINLIAIDEAHCISEWGHDFRPAYLKIPIVKELTDSAPIIALTATATAKVLEDIVCNLEIDGATIIKQSLSRKNLSLRIIHSEDIYYHIKNILQKSAKPSILYANSRKKVRTVSNFLNKHNFKSTYYHGGLSAEEKKSSFESWMEEKTPVMVATNAFGMGIDKSNVGCIIHLDLPFSLENYMQEAGRAGRDGELAFSYIFSNENTISELKKRFSKGLVSVDFAKTIYNNINSYLNISYGELPEAPFDFDLNDFCLHYKTQLLPTYNALKLFERENILLFDENLHNRSTLKFIASPEVVLQYAERNNTLLIKTILRSYGGIFEQAVSINESALATKINRTTDEIKNMLIAISKDGLTHYNYQKNIARLHFIVPREDNFTINNISSNIKKQNKIREEKIHSVIQYAKNNSVCRSRYLLNYFDEKLIANCGICDICERSDEKINRKDDQQISVKILELFHDREQLSTKEIINELNLDANIVLRVLQLLLDTNKINITSHNKLEKVKNE